MGSKKTPIYGVGINDVEYHVTKREKINAKWKITWRCPYYATWSSMLERCYSEKKQNTNPTYRGCTVSEEWLTFSNFRKWMIEQEWEGMQLDKDLLVSGNKHYSAETCVFVTQQVNNFLVDSGKTRGKYLIGVYLNKGNNKYISSCRNPFTTKQEHLGYFNNEAEAHKTWLSKKLEHAYALAAIQTDERIAIALISRYLNYGL